MTTQQIKREFESHESHGQICRLCMSEESLGDVLKDDQLTEWIWELLAIKISGDDRMSQVICAICRIRLTEFHQFRMGCHEVQEVLQALIPGGTSNTPVQMDPKATNHLRRIGIVDDSLIRCEVCLLFFNDEKQLTNHKTIHDHENQKDIQVKSELDENDEFQVQTNDRRISFEKAGISSHIQDEEMENDLLGIEGSLVVEEVKIETPADDEVVASAESQHNTIENKEVYRCDICQNVYSNKIKLRKHKNYHEWKLKKQANPEEEVSNDQIHQCDGCPKTFLTRKLLIAHKKNVHGPKLHRCDICDVQFSMRFEMTKHLHTIKHMNKEEEIQRRVNEKSSNQNEKICKVGEKHDNTKTMNDSNVSFDDMLAMYQSYRSIKKDGRKLLKCNECDETFSNSYSLRSHRQYHKPKEIVCHVCEKPYQNGFMLKRHLATHASPAERQQARQVKENAPRPYKCDICKKAFVKKSNLSHHNKIVHGPKKFQCEICGYKFPANNMLKNHLQKHALSGHTKEDFQALKKLSQQNDETSNPNYDDELSDQSSVPSDNETNENDKAHKDPSKSDENSSEIPAGQPFQCHEASETEVHLYRHKRQQRNMHMTIHEPASTSTKVFKCPECNKIYPSWKNLYFHVKDGHVRMKTLPEERTVACPKCDKMFQTAPQRDLHMRTVHTAAEPTCEICNKKFSVRVQLWQHMHNQHGKKPASSYSEDTTDESDLEDSVQNSNEERTKPLEENASVEEET